MKKLMAMIVVVMAVLFILSVSATTHAEIFIVWQADVNHPNQEGISTIKLTPDNENILVFGSSNSHGSPIIIDMLNPSNGSLIWSKPLAKSGKRLVNGWIDSTGNIYIMSVWNGYTLWKYDPELITELGSYSGPTSFEYVMNMITDELSNIYATGFFGSGSGQGSTLVKLDSNCNLIWTKKYTATSGLDDYNEGLALDSNNNVFRGGSDNQGTTTGHGRLLGHNATDGGIFLNVPVDEINSSIYGLITDNSDNIIIGYSYDLFSPEGPRTTQVRTVIQKLDQSGTSLWKYTFPDIGMFMCNNNCVVKRNDNSFCVAYNLTIEGAVYPGIAEFDIDGNLVWRDTLNEPGWFIAGIDTDGNEDYTYVSLVKESDRGQGKVLCLASEPPVPDIAFSFNQSQAMSFGIIGGDKTTDTDAGVVDFFATMDDVEYGWPALPANSVGLVASDVGESSFAYLGIGLTGVDLSGFDDFEMTLSNDDDDPWQYRLFADDGVNDTETAWEELSSGQSYSFTLDISSIGSNSEIGFQIGSGREQWMHTSTEISPLLLSSPNGGEELIAGQTETITWDSAGDISFVNIEYSSDNGNTWEEEDPNTPNDGEYDWAVPEVASNQCLIRISDATDTNVYDTSIDVFTIFVCRAGYDYVTEWGTSGSGNGEFDRPYDVDIDSSGDVYVADISSNRIQKFDSNGEYITQWGTPGRGDGQFDNPQGVAVDSLGDVYIVDRYNHRIQKFTTDGNFIGWWGGCTDAGHAGSGHWHNPDDGHTSEFGSSDGQFKHPVGVFVDSSNYVYVADKHNNRIQKFTTSGIYLLQWGSSGSGDGQFVSPYDIASDSSDYVYVADRDNNRIQKFTSSGTYVDQWGYLGSSNGEFDHPYEVIIDSAGYVYVADVANHRIQKFGSDGMFISKWGSFGTGDGQFNNPVGIATDTYGYIYVADADNHRVQKFEPEGPLFGDVNSDCYFNLLDFAVLASQWLECGNPFDSNCGY